MAGRVVSLGGNKTKDKPEVLSPDTVNGRFFPSVSFPVEMLFNNGK